MKKIIVNVILAAVYIASLIATAVIDGTASLATAIINIFAGVALVDYNTDYVRNI